jgi:TonB family protein
LRLKSILLASCFWLTVVSLAQQPASQQPASKARLYRVGVDKVKPPQAIFTPAPEMPPDKRKIKSTAIAIISGYVGTDGLFHSGRVLRSTGDSTLDAKALDRLNTWKFHPCTKDGEPVNCALDLEVEFRLYSKPE